MTLRKANQTDIDPELQRQLDAAGDNDSVEAVFTLRSPQDKPYLDAKETHDAVARILADAGSKAKDLKVFGNIQSFAMAGPPNLVRKLIDHKQIAAAAANRQN